MRVTSSGVYFVFLPSFFIILSFCFILSPGVLSFPPRFSDKMIVPRFHFLHSSRNILGAVCFQRMLWCMRLLHLPVRLFFKASNFSSLIRRGFGGRPSICPTLVNRADNGILTFFTIKTQLKIKYKKPYPGNNPDKALK